MPVILRPLYRPRGHRTSFRTQPLTRLLLGDGEFEDMSAVRGIGVQIIEEAFQFFGLPFPVKQL